MKKLEIKFDGNVILEVDDFDIFTCYQDLWKIKSEKRDAVRKGIISDNGCDKLRINAKDKSALILEIMLLATHTGTNLLFSSTLKCLTVRCPVTN